MLLKNVLHQKLNWVSMFHVIERTGHIIFETTKGNVLFLSGKLALQIGFESDIVSASKPDIPSTLISRHHKKCCVERKFSQQILSM